MTRPLLNPILMFLSLCGTSYPESLVHVRSDIPDPTKIPSLEVYTKEEWGRSFDYLGIVFPNVPGLICDLWCFESEGIEFATAEAGAAGSLRMRHDWRDHGYWIDTTAIPEEGEVEVCSILTPKEASTEDGLESFPGLNICWQLRRAEGFNSALEEYPDFVKRCFIYTESGRTFLDQTDRLPIPVRPISDKENRPPWVQMYTSLAGPVQQSGTQSWSAFSPDRYRYPLIGAISKDGRHLTAIGNASFNTLSQAWHDCMHNNATWTRNKSGQWEWRIRIYALENNEDLLLSRFLDDFPQADAHSNRTSSPIRIGDKSQLFLDDFLISEKSGLERRVNPVIKSNQNPVLRPTEPWEGDLTIVYGSVIYEEGLFRMWYYGSPGVCYAESQDGIQWEKPELDLVEFEGRKTNLVIDRQSPQSLANPFQHFYELFGVLKDTEEPNPQRRYKMGVLSIHRDYRGPREDPFHPGQRRGLGIATSPDGIHWQEGFDFATESICDGATHMMWDPNIGNYVVYGRTKYIDPQLLNSWDNDWANEHYWGRSVARAACDNLIHWPETAPGSAPRVMAVDDKDPPGSEIYGMNVFPYEGIYIALLQMFYNQPDDCFLDVQLATSRDGVHFERISDRSPFIPVGGVGEWDRFNQSPANNPPIEVGDDLRFYYGGRTYRHSPYNGPDKGDSFGGVGFGSIQRDRFASLQASFEGGQLTTQPLLLESTGLIVNAESEFGEIKVALLDEKGAILAESEPIHLSSLRIPVRWIDPQPILPSGPVRLRFSLRNAKLYSFQCDLPRSESGR